MHQSCTTLRRCLAGSSARRCYQSLSQVSSERKSRLDGGEEVDGSSRTSLEVTPSEKRGHVVRERTVEAELRDCRNFYSEVPLTGCQRSASPTYWLAQAFGQIEVSHSHCLWDPRSRAPFSNPEPWIEDEKGETFGFRPPDGREASAGEVEWKRTLAIGRGLLDETRGVLSLRTTPMIARTLA